jgi:hypothetical protein
VFEPAVGRFDGSVRGSEAVEVGEDVVSAALGRGGLEAGEPVHRDHLDRVAPRIGSLGQPRVTQRAGTSATTTPPRIRAVGLDDRASEDRAIRFETLAGHLEPELVKAAESRQISAAEPGNRARRDGSVGHVDVFQVDGVGTSSLGRPRPSSQQRRADPTRPSL